MQLGKATISLHRCEGLIGDLDLTRFGGVEEEPSGTFKRIRSDYDG